MPCERIILDQFLKEEKKNLIELILLNLEPGNEVQYGGACGYYAMSSITAYWQKKISAPFFPARKENYPNPASPLKSLKRLGKPIVPTKNGIFNMNYFQEILEKTDYYTSELFRFDTIFDCLIIIKHCLQAGFPLIFPMDLDAELLRGSKAHYVILVGLLVTKTNLVQCLFISNNNLYRVNFQELFDSCMNLEVYPEKTITYRKLNLKTGYFYSKSFFVPRIGLEGMKGKLAVPYPLSYHPQFDNLKEIIQTNLSLSKQIQAALLDKQDITIPSQDGKCLLDELLQMKVELSYDLIQLFDKKVLESQKLTPTHLSYLLYNAIEKNDLEFFSDLIKLGAEINSQVGKNGDTPLHLAIDKKREEMIKILINKGASLVLMNTKGITPFNLAVKQYQNNLNEFFPLINENKKSFDEVFAIKDAILNHDFNLLEILLNYEFDPNQIDPSQLTPLYYAVHCQWLIAVEMLLKKGADVNKKYSGNKSLLFLAVEYRKVKKDIIKLLLDYSANVNYEREGLSVLHAAIIARRNPEIIELLLEYGADPNKANHDGKTPLDFALQYNFIELTEVLIRSRTIKI